jgi:hypothetical protein
LKKIAFILLLLFSCSLGWTQQFVVLERPVEKEKTFSEEEYNQLLNHTPKSFVSDTKTKPKNRVLEGDLNSINSLELRYAYQQQLKLSMSEIKWLEDEINSLAVAFFKEGKPIIMEKAGGNEGCHDRGIETEQRNGVTITLFKFCYTCPGQDVIEDRFLQIFNNRTEKLIEARK